MSAVLLVMFEVLDRSFVRLCRLSARECSKIPALAGLRTLLPRVKTVFTTLELSNHTEPPSGIISFDFDYGCGFGCGWLSRLRCGVPLIRVSARKLALASIVTGETQPNGPSF